MEIVIAGRLPSARDAREGLYARFRQRMLLALNEGAEYFLCPVRIEVEIEYRHEARLSCVPLILDLLHEEDVITGTGCADVPELCVRCRKSERNACIVRIDEMREK